MLQYMIVAVRRPSFVTCRVTRACALLLYGLFVETLTPVKDEPAELKKPALPGPSVQITETPRRKEKESNEAVQEKGKKDRMLQTLRRKSENDTTLSWLVASLTVFLRAPSEDWPFQGSALGVRYHRDRWPFFFHAGGWATANYALAYLRVDWLASTCEHPTALQKKEVTYIASCGSHVACSVFVDALWGAQKPPHVVLCAFQVFARTVIFISFYWFVLCQCFCRLVAQRSWLAP